MKTEVAILLPTRTEGGGWTVDRTRTETVEAFRVESVRGLAYHPSWTGRGWSVTHERSGREVSAVASREAALAETERLGPLADWTLDAEALRASLGGRKP